MCLFDAADVLGWMTIRAFLTLLFPLMTMETALCPLTLKLVHVISKFVCYFNKCCLRIVK